MGLGTRLRGSARPKPAGKRSTAARRASAAATSLGGGEGRVVPFYKKRGADGKGGMTEQGRVCRFSTTRRGGAGHRGHGLETLRGSRSRRLHARAVLGSVSHDGYSNGEGGERGLSRA